MNKKTLVDTNYSLKSLLLSFAKLFKADAVILYQYIKQEDIEATELLSLLESSPVSNTEEFFSDIIKNDFIKNYDTGLNGIINDFRNGELSNDKKTEAAFEELKENIRVLRFSAHAEQNPDKSRWNFDYNKRPPKYLVFSDEILMNPENAIKHEGMTAYFCRVKQEKIDQLKTQLKEEKISDLRKELEINNHENNEINEAIHKLQKQIQQINKKDVVKNLILERKDLRSHPSHSIINPDPNVYDNFSSHHAAWLILKDPEDSTKLRGCLRFEFYDQNSIGEIIDSAEEKLLDYAVQSVNELVMTNVLNVLKKNREFSYEKMYKCLDPILKHIRDIGNDKRHEKAKSFNDQKDSNDDEVKELFDIHYQIEHLFYVLKRNTYFGDDIIKRINYFIKVLLEKLSLPSEIFSDVWDRLKRHEDLMLYDLDKYRDHLMHQFHTFICGYIIIHKLKLEYFQKLINTNYVHLISKKEKTTGFTKLDVLRIWTLASLFHDCGYAFEKLSEGLEIFSKRVSGIELKSKFFWDDFIFKGEDIVPKIFQNLSAYYIMNSINAEQECKLKLYHSKLTESFIFRILTQKVLSNNDHGVLSSIILMQQYYKHKAGFLKNPRIAQIINIACLAISLHNKPVFSEINTKDNTGICLSLNPIIFLLVYCDTATEWGRIKASDTNDSNFSGTTKEGEDNKNFVSPYLRDICIDKDDVDEKCIKTSILLDYPAHENGVYLDPEKIDKYLSNVLTSFISPKEKSFELKYEIRGSNADCRSKRFMNCSYCHNE